MKVNARIKKLLSVALVGGTILSSLAGMSFADNLDKAKQTEDTGLGKGKMMQGHKKDMQGNFEDILSKLVEKGTITQAEADKWKTFHEEKMTERKAEMEKVKAMTEEERAAYFEANKDQRGPKGDQMSDLVEAGILTQDKADSIQNSMQQEHQQEAIDRMNEKFTKLVEDGTITQAEADKWKAFEEEKMTERKAEMEKIKDMTQEERNAYFEANKSERKDMMSELVEAGVLTQEKADAIKAKMPQKSEKNREYRNIQKINN